MSGHPISTAGVAVILTAVGAVAGASQAEAALYYWNDHDPGYYRPAQPLQARKPKVRRNAIDKKSKAAEKETGALRMELAQLVRTVDLAYEANDADPL